MQGLKRIAVICAATLVVAGCGGGKGGGGTGTQPATPGAHDPGPTQKVHLNLNSGAWKVKVNGGQEKDPKDAKSKIDPGDGPTLFVVSIQGNANATFRDSGALSVWVGSKNAPPTQPGTIPDQIIGPFISKNKKILIFYDLNRGDAVTLNYALYFNEPTIPSVDPIIENGGGSWLDAA